MLIASIKTKLNWTLSFLQPKIRDVPDTGYPAGRISGLSWISGRIFRVLTFFLSILQLIIRVAPDIRPAGYPAFFGIRYPAGYPVTFAGYPAGYPAGRIAGYPAGYPARKTVLN